MKASISHTCIWWQMDYQDKQTFKRNLWWPSTSTQQVVSEPLSHGKCPVSLVLFKIKSFTRKPYQKVCLPLHLLIKLSTKWTYLNSTIFKHYFTNADWLNTREEGFFLFWKKQIGWICIYPAGEITMYCCVWVDWLILRIASCITRLLIESVLSYVHSYRHPFPNKHPISEIPWHKNYIWKLFLLHNAKDSEENNTRLTK